MLHLRHICIYNPTCVLLLLSLLLLLLLLLEPTPPHIMSFT